MHVCIEYVFCCLFGTRRYPPTHTTGDNICLWNNQQFINSFASLNMYTSTNFRVRWGFLFEQVFVFYWILQGCTYCQWILFEQLVSSTIVWKSVRTLFEQLVSSTIIWKSVKMLKTFNHLALLTVLSALRHGWGMLALCCGEIERYFLKLDSQPTLVLPNIRNKNRATVADDRARCDTPKNLCIVLILPLAALRITYGKRISSDACLYTALKWNSCSQ